MNRIASIFLLSLAACTAATAQAPFNLTVNVLPPYPVQVSEWERHPERLIFTITPLGPVTQLTEAKLAGRLEKLDGSVRIATRAGYVPIRPIRLGPGVPFPYQVSTAEVRGLFQEDSFDFSGVDADDLSAGGRLPEGDYRLCLRLVDVATEAVLAEEGCSMPFTVRFADAPVPQMPWCGDTFAPVVPEIVTFRWSAPDAPLATRYAFSLVEVPEGLSPDDALDASGIVFERTVTGVNEVIYGLDPSDRTRFPLRPGTRYAWRVRAEDPARSVTFENDGMSPACSFLFDPDPVEDGLLVTAAAPSGFPLVFTPSVTVRPLTYTFTNTTSEPITVVAYTDRTRHAGGAVTEDVVDLAAVEFFDDAVPPGASRTWTSGYVVDEARRTRMLGGADSVRIRVTSTFRGIDAAGRNHVAVASPEVALVIRRYGGLEATVEVAGGLPLIYDPGVTMNSVTYVLTNTYHEPITITGYIDRSVLPDGTVRESRVDDVSAFDALRRPIPPGETRRWRVDLPISLENQSAVLAMAGSGDASVRSTTIFRGAASGAYVFMAEAEPAVEMLVRRTGDLQVNVSSPEGFPVEFRPDQELRPLTYEFENRGSRSLRIDSIATMVRKADGSVLISSIVPIDAPISLAPGERRTSSQHFRLGSATQLRALETATREVTLRVGLTFYAYDDTGAPHPGTAGFDAVVRPTLLRVSVSSSADFPLAFYPGVRQYPVTYTFENNTARDVRVRRIHQEILDEPGATSLEIGTYDRPTPLLVPAGGTVVDSAQFGFEEAFLSRHRATAPEVPLRVLLTFEADDDSGARQTASTSFRAVVYESAIQALELEAAYPAVNDTIPWTDFGMIVRFAPYSDLYRRVTYDLDVQEEPPGSTLISNHTRTLSWPDGPRISQGWPAGGEYEDRARYNYVNVDGRPPSPVAWPRPLVRGHGHLWQVEGTFRDSSGTERTVRADGAFVTGMRRPILEAPAREAVISIGDSITFRWHPNRPASLFPPDVVAMRGATGGITFGAADEAWWLEVARDSSFADSSLVIARHRERLIFTEGDPASIDSAFAEKSVTPSHSWSPGTYYWRVQWLRPGGDPYLTSPVHRFTVGTAGALALRAARPADGAVVTDSTELHVQATRALTAAEIRSVHLEIWRVPAVGSDETVVRADSNRVLNRTFNVVRLDSADARILTVLDGGSPYLFTGTAGDSYLWRMGVLFAGGDTVRSAAARFSFEEDAACGIDCTIDPPANTTVASVGDFRGRTVRIGRFNLQIDEATGSPSSLRGRGSVHVPFFRAPLRVAFSDLRINTDDQVISGEATAETDQPSLLSDDLRSNFSRGSEIGVDQAVLHAVHDLASDATRLVSLFTGDAPVSLPVGVDRTIAGQVLVAAIVGVKFTPTTARMNAVLDIPLPELDTRFGLGVRDVCLTPSGLGSEAVFYLSSDLSIALAEFDGSLPDYTAIVKQGNFDGTRPRGTFCRWSCEGIEEINLSMEHVFPRTWMIPVDASGTDSGGNAKAQFELNLTDTTGGWDWLVGASMDRAMFADAPGFFFEAHDVTYDNSPVRNAAGMVFPAGYRDSEADTSGIGEAWTGFYIRNLTLYLPEELKRFDDSRARLNVGVENLLLDRTGPSFTAALNDILVLDGDSAGNLAGWMYSIDELNVQFLHGSFRRGQLNGRIRLPVSDTAFVYAATLARPRPADSAGPAGSSEGSASADDLRMECASILRSGSTPPGLIIEFLIRPSGTVPVDLWLGTMNLAATSKICAGNQAGGLQAGVSLNGELSIVDSEHEIPLNLDGIAFENVRLMTFSPYASAGTWARSSPQHSIGAAPAEATSPAEATASTEAAGFSVNIADVGLVTASASGGGVRIGVQFDLDVALPGADALLRARAEDLTVWGALSPPSSTEPVEARFDGVDVSGICVGGAMSIVSVTGRDGRDLACLTFYHTDDDRGFRGDAAATFAEQIAAEVSVQFGTKTDGRGTFDYWYVDGGVRSSAPLVPAGAVAVYGFLGGAWYNMNPPALPDYTAVASGSAGGGRSYTAARGSGFGLKAGLVIGTIGSPDTFNADVELGADFTGGGALERLFLRGHGYMMTAMTDRSDPPVEAEVIIDYIQRPPPALSRGPVLDAHFNIAVNMDPVLTSRNVGTHLYISPEKWWVRVGNPAGPRAEVEVLDFFTMNAYLAAGDELPALPAPPPGAAHIRRDPRDVTDVAGGSGFMFGASVQMDFSYSAVVYLDVNAGTGFDIAFRNAEVFCDVDGVMQARGYDFWYAQGQMYAWIAIGFGLDLPVIGRAEVAEAAARATLEGGFPNPAYAAGRAELYISLLGGAIVFDEGVDFRFGQPCRAVAESPLADIEIITELRPGPPDGAVSPFTEPTALFFINAERPFTIEDAVGVAHTYRIQTDGIELRQGSASGPPVNCRRLLIETGAAVLCKPTDARDHYAPLEPNTTYFARIEAYIEELQGTAWVRASTRSGETIAASKETTFRTGPLPRTLEGLVQYSYPFEGQRYFLQDACAEGVVVARQPIGHLARHDSDMDREGARISFLARFVPLPDGPPIEVQAELRNNNGFTFPIPNLEPEKIYGLQLVRRARPLVDLDVVSGTRDDLRGEALGRHPFLAQVYERTGDAQLRQRSLSRLTEVKPDERLLHSFVFRTSRYRTLQEKMRDASLARAQYESRPAVLFVTHDLTTSLEPSEPFDVFDLRGAELVTTFGIGEGARTISRRGEPLVRALPKNDNRWWRRYVEPRIIDPINEIRRFGYPHMIRTVFTASEPMVVFSSGYAEPPLPSDPGELADRYFPTGSRGGSRLTIAGGGSSGVMGSGSILSAGSGPAISATGFSRTIISPSTRTGVDLTRRRYPLRYRAGTLAFADHLYNVRLNVPRVLRRSDIPSDVRRNLQAAYATAFTPPERGTYELRFLFTPPPAACTAAPDAVSAPTFTRPFTY